MKILVILLLFIFASSLSFAITPNLQSRLKMRGLTSENFVWVFYNQETNEILLEKETLMQFLTTFVKKSYLTPLDLEPTKEGYYTLNQIKASGIDIRFNEAELDFYLDVPSDAYEAQLMAISGDYRKNYDAYELPSDWSTYLNARVFYNIEQDKDIPTKKEFEYNLEWVAHYKNWVLENEIIHFPDRSFDKTRRINSSLTKDFQEKMIRLRLGDINYQPVGLQLFTPFMGVSLQREFSINPKYRRGSFHYREIILDRPSEVEVYVNNNLVGRRKYLPGPVDIRDFPFFNGENEVLIKIIDDLGEVREEFFSILHDFRTLPVGQSDFHFNLGFMTDFTDPMKMPETNRPIAIGYYDYGYSENLLLGGNLGVSKENQLLGAQARFATKQLGFTTVHGALSNSSTDQNRNGLGVKIENITPISTNGKLNNFQFRLAGEYRTRSFNNVFSPDSLSLFVNNTPFKYSGDLYISSNASNQFRSGIGIRYNKAYTGFSSSTTYYANISWRIVRNILLNARYQTIVRSNDIAGTFPTDSSVFFSLSWYNDKGNSQAYISHDPIDEITTANYQYYHSTGIDTYRFQSFYNHFPAVDTATFAGEYTNQRVQLLANHSLSYSDNFSKANFNQSTRIGIGTAFAWAGNQVAISRPITDSFVLVNTEPGIEQDLAINRSRDRALGEINRFGPAVLYNFTSYNFRQVKADASSLPPGLNLDQERRFVSSRYKSGSSIKLKVTGELALSGKLMDPNGKFLAHEVGSVVKIEQDLTRNEFSRFFTNESGDFFIEGLVEGVYYLELDNTEWQPLKLEVDNGFGIKDIGIQKLQFAQ